VISFPIRLDIFKRTDNGLEPAESVALTEPGSYTLGRLPRNDIVLSSPEVSRDHAFINASEDGLEVVDRSSSFGTFIGKERVTRAAWTGDEHLRIDPFEIRLRASASRPAEPAEPRGGIEVALDKVTIVRKNEAEQRRIAAEQRFPNSIFTGPVVSMTALRSGPYLYSECEYLALGGGLGSFVWVDFLRCYGVNKNSIRVVGNVGWDLNNPADFPRPYDSYRRLCLNSQIPDHERLRSNSISTPDNIWGFPGYASRETWRELKHFRLGGLKYIFQVFGEPAIAESFTPRSGDVFRSIDREAARIGWKEMCIPGRVLAMRKTDDGRYAVAFRLEHDFAPDGNREKIIVAHHVQVATGYPAYRTEDDIFRFNQENFQRRLAFKAYDQHDVVYFNLEQTQTPATVVVRGRGIVASRILQRLYEARAKNKNIVVVHQMRRALGPRDGNVFRGTQRAVFNNTEHQAFNWPKSCWGGELRRDLDEASPEQRSPIYDKLGGTTTADREDWKNIIRRGTREGWYRVVIGKLDIKGLVVENGRHKIAMAYQGADGAFPRELTVDYVIDCIGLIGNVNNSEFLHDLIQTYQLPRNRDFTKAERPELGIAVTSDFEIRPLRSGHGRVYAAGQITGHGPFGAVDSFLGLAYSALRSVDHLNRVRAPGVSRFGPLRSFGQWLRWCRNVPP
jgi:pSer/pThr/pTyr-binding forkhead associated (FHA) protein